MYLARFESDDACILKGAVRLPVLPRRERGEQPEWRNLFRNLARIGDAVPTSYSSLRVELSAAGSIERVLTVSAPDDSETALRRYLGSFTLLERLVPDSTEFPVTRASYDEWTTGFPTLQCCLLPPVFRIGDAYLTCDFRVGPWLSELLGEAQSLRHNIAYQAHVGWFRPDEEQLRAARKNALYACNVQRAPRGLATLQHRLAEGLATTVAVVEEFLGVATSEAARWLAGRLTQRFQREYGRLGFEPPELNFTSDAHTEELRLGIHRQLFMELPIAEVCASALDIEALTEILGWQPAPELELGSTQWPAPPIEVKGPRKLRVVVGRETANGGLVARQLPPPHWGKEPFLFVSYSHADLQRIEPILRTIIGLGVPIWYDHNIPGGAEWDAVLEDRVQRCCCLVVFLSKAAIQSKWVRREVKYADVLGKPLLPIKLEEVELRSGMAILLTQFQVIDPAVTQFESQFREALRLHGGLSV